MGIKYRTIALQQINKMLYKVIPYYPVVYTTLRYYQKFSRMLNLKTPVTFNEKLNCLKFSSEYQKYAFLADKYTVKEYVKNIIGEKYIIKNFLVCNNTESINFSALPEKFVIKPNHTSGNIIICNNKEELNIKEVLQSIKYWLYLDYYYLWFEPVYKNIKKKILFEEFFSEESSELRDYKFYCFNGEVKFIHVDIDRHTQHTRNFYSRDWEPQNFMLKYPNSQEKINPPSLLDEMIFVAEELSCNMPFVRVDLYHFYNQIKFGELTFFPGSGLEKFSPGTWDNIFGDYLVLEGKNFYASH